MEGITMQVPIQVTFRHMEHSEAIEALIRRKVARLVAFPNNIMGCRVVVEPDGKHHEYGNLYQVRIDITVPGEEIVVVRQPCQHTECRDISVALHDAFDSARRKLEDYVRRRRGYVKTLETAPHARVSKLSPEDNYGFLATPDGREIFFHRHSVL